MSNYKLYGAILGDLVGKPYEMKPIYSKDFDWYNPQNHWTDDTIMTLATAHKLIYDTDYTLEYKWWGNRYYGDYYGKAFKEWLKRKDWTSNDSYGNGAAMRVAPIGYAISWPYDIVEAYNSSVSSHKNDEAIKGATFVAHAIRHLYLGNFGDAHELAGSTYGIYGLMQPLPFPKFKVNCDATVPVAYQVFNVTKDKSIEDCIRLAVSLGGDCDTIGSMAAEMWVAYNQGLDQKYIQQVEDSLDYFQLETLHKFNERF